MHVSSEGFWQVPEALRVYIYIYIYVDVHVCIYIYTHVCVFEVAGLVPSTRPDGLGKSTFSLP